MVLRQKKNRKNNNKYFLLQVMVKYKLDDIFYKVTFFPQQRIIFFSAKNKVPLKIHSSLYFGLREWGKPTKGIPSFSVGNQLNFFVVPKMKFKCQN